MQESKVVGWVVTGLVVLFLFWLVGLIFGLGLKIIGFIFAILGAFLSLLLSKPVIALAAVALIVYILFQRAQKNDRNLPGL